MLSEREKLIKNMLQERIQLRAYSENINVSLKINQHIIDHINRDLYQHRSQTYQLVVGRKYDIADNVYYELLEVRPVTDEHLVYHRVVIISNPSYIKFDRTLFRDINIDMICE